MGGKGESASEAHAKSQVPSPMFCRRQCGRDWTSAVRLSGTGAFRARPPRSICCVTQLRSIPQAPHSPVHALWPGHTSWQAAPRQSSLQALHPAVRETAGLKHCSVQKLQSSPSCRQNSFQHSKWQAPSPIALRPFVQLLTVPFHLRHNDLSA